MWQLVVVAAVVVDVCGCAGEAGEWELAEEHSSKNQNNGQQAAAEKLELESCSVFVAGQRPGRKIEWRHGRQSAQAICVSQKSVGSGWQAGKGAGGCEWLGAVPRRTKRDTEVEEKQQDAKPWTKR